MKLRTMFTRCSLVVAVFIVAASTKTQAQTLDDVSVSVAVKGAVNGRAELEVTLRNGSQKIITAWAWSSEGRYADASTRSHSGTVDVITDLLGPDKFLAFRPGTSRTFEDSLPLGPSAGLPVSAVVHLTMVAFDDDTAVGDPAEIGGFSATRKSMAASEAEELDQVEKAVKGPSPKDALRAVIADRSAKSRGAGISRQILSLLENDAPADAVESARAAFRAYQMLLSAHWALEAK
ncbi:MAG: hypothetical protein ACLQGV_12535 [Bryobacteraceae bacterium]